MNKFKLMMLAVLLVALSGYSQDTTLLDLTFDNPSNPDTVGNLPLGLGAAMSPGTTEGNNRIVVIDSLANKAGTGLGVEIVDDDTLSGTRMEYEISPSQSAIRWDFSFSPGRVDGPGASYFNAAVTGPGLSTSSSANRFATLRLYENGTVRFQAGAAPGAIGAYIPVVKGGLYRVSFFVNDKAEPIAYTDPNGVAGNLLPADSVDYWMDAADGNGIVYIGGGQIQGGGAAGSISEGTNGLGRVGFGSTSGAIGLNYIVDDIKITKIVPPAGPGTLSLYLLGE